MATSKEIEPTILSAVNIDLTDDESCSGSSCARPFEFEIILMVAMMGMNIFNPIFNDGGS